VGKAPGLAPRRRATLPAMQQLLLLRHAKSSWDDSAQSDHARPLNPRGRRAAAQLRTIMRELGLVPDVVLVSSARRTLQTLEALSPWDETPIVEPMDGLYLADVSRLREAVRSVAETVRSLMLVGHNPGLHEFAVMLAGAQGLAPTTEMGRRLTEGFPAGALAEFGVARAWRELGEGSGQLVRFVCPGDATDGGS